MRYSRIRERVRRAAYVITKFEIAVVEFCKAKMRNLSSLVQNSHIKLALQVKLCANFYTHYTFKTLKHFHSKVQNSHIKLALQINLRRLN